MALSGDQRFYMASSVADAVAALRERGVEGVVLAGATWLMRAALRNERSDRSYVAISKLEDLRRIDIRPSTITIGACVTHAELARAIAHVGSCRALASAAAHAANPAVREVATVGGNLCSPGFAASDLTPALICLDAQVELETPSGIERLPIEQFLQLRDSLPPGWLLRNVAVAQPPRRSTHARLTLRKAGDYPVAIVSVAVTLNANGQVDSARVAVGSVEARARRWEHVERGMIGRLLDAQHAADLAERHAGDFAGRDAVEAPGWYREKVLATVVRRAVADLQSQL